MPGDERRETCWGMLDALYASYHDGEWTVPYLAARDESGSFDRYIWGFVGGEPLRKPPPARFADVPARTPESDEMSKALRKRGFTFAGSTICYAFMQAVGMVNDHLAACPKAARAG